MALPVSGSGRAHGPSDASVTLCRPKRNCCRVVVSTAEMPFLDPDGRGYKAARLRLSRNSRRIVSTLLTLHPPLIDKGQVLARSGNETRRTLFEKRGCTFLSVRQVHQSGESSRLKLCRLSGMARAQHVPHQATAHCHRRRRRMISNLARQFACSGQ